MSVELELRHVAWVPEAVAIATATIVLVRRCHSRRATCLAIAALGGLAGDWLFSVAVVSEIVHWPDAFSDAERMQLIQWYVVLGQIWRGGCIVLLVCAVAADRRPAKLSGPEADYSDLGRQSV